MVRQIARDRHQRIAHGVGATGNQRDGAEGRKILPLRQAQAKVRSGELRCRVLQQGHGPGHADRRFRLREHLCRHAYATEQTFDVSAKMTDEFGETGQRSGTYQQGRRFAHAA